jgi:hypothetical protein
MYRRQCRPRWRGSRCGAGRDGRSQCENRAYRSGHSLQCGPGSRHRLGVLDLATEMEGCRFSIGLRNSHDKSMRLAMTCGYRVFVCSNMAFAGDFTPVEFRPRTIWSLSHAFTSAFKELDPIPQSRRRPSWGNSLKLGFHNRSSPRGAVSTAPPFPNYQSLR